MATWEERIKSGNPTDLHNERFSVWHKFIDEFKQNYETYNNITMQKQIEQRPLPYTEFETTVVALGKTFSKVLLVSEGIPLYIFDASFGSLDPSSDLDVVVIAIDTAVIHAWNQFLVENRTGQYTFTAYYDSNFYFEPAVRVINNNGHSLLISMAKHNLRAALSKDATMGSEMGQIEAYATAYIEQAPLRVKAGGRYYTVYPNPLSPNVDQDAELEQYTAMAHCGQLCFEEYSPVTAAKLASTKSEALISTGSLAICGVFGQKIQTAFINDRTPNRAWRLVAAFEMLYNIKMHRHVEGEDIIIKSKYLTRLNNVLLRSNFTCTNNYRQRITRYITANQQQYKNIQEQWVIQLVNAVIEDEINEEDCPKKFEWNTSLDDNIERVKLVILNRASSIVLRSQYHTFASNTE